MYENVRSKTANYTEGYVYIVFFFFILLLNIVVDSNKYTPQSMF